MISNAIHSILSGDSTLTDIVPATRMQPTLLVQEDSLPTNYIVFTKLGVQPNDTKQGVSTTDFVSMQIECYSDDRDEAVTMSERVRVLLDRYSGTAASIEIESIQYKNTMEAQLTQIERYLVASDYIIQQKK